MAKRALLRVLNLMLKHKLDIYVMNHSEKPLDDKMISFQI